MTTKVTCFLFLALFFAMLPVRRLDAAIVGTWQQAYQGCQDILAYAQGQFSPTNAYYPTGCVAVPASNFFNFSTVGKGDVSCHSFGYPPDLVYDCVWSGADPPDCRNGATEPTWDSISSWPDGTKCDQGCQVGLLVGGSLSGSYFETGQYCPYDPAANPPSPPPDQPPAEQPPECNADGSCVTCIGDTCATTDAQPAPNPPPPAPGGSSGNHETNTTNNTTNNYNETTVTSGSSSGDPASGGSTSGSSTSQTTGSGTSQSEGKCTDGVCDVGEADGNIGGLYKGSGQTPQGVFSGFVAQVKGAPIVSAVGGFFEVQAGGSCPSWHIPGNQYWGAAGFDFTFFCQPGMLAIFELAGWLVLAGAAFCAFRIAIY